MTIRTLYYGDNLEVLRDKLADESVDMIYLDPPFNSNRDYNSFFKESSGKKAASQIRAFTDTWEWTGQTEEAYDDLAKIAPMRMVEMVNGFIGFFGA